MDRFISTTPIVQLGITKSPGVNNNTS